MCGGGLAKEWILQGGGCNMGMLCYQQGNPRSSSVNSYNTKIYEALLRILTNWNNAFQPTFPANFSHQLFPPIFYTSFRLKSEAAENTVIV